MSCARQNKGAWHGSRNALGLQLPHARPAAGAAEPPRAHAVAASVPLRALVADRVEEEVENPGDQDHLHQKDVREGFWGNDTVEVGAAILALSAIARRAAVGRAHTDALAVHGNLAGVDLLAEEVAEEPAVCVVALVAGAAREVSIAYALGVDGTSRRQLPRQDNLFR